MNLCKKCHKEISDLNRSKLYCGKCLDKYKADNKKYYLKHKEESYERSKKRLNEKREEIKIYYLEWTKNNRDKANKYRRNWRRKNPEATILENTKRRLRLMNAKINGEISKGEWNNLLNLYGNKCLKCGSKEKITLDHIIPLFYGGKHILSNIQPLCLSCNASKGTKIIDYRQSALVQEWT